MNTWYAGNKPTDREEMLYIMTVDFRVELHKGYSRDEHGTGTWWVPTYGYTVQEGASAFLTMEDAYDKVFEKVTEEIVRLNKIRESVRKVHQAPILMPF